MSASFTVTLAVRSRSAGSGSHPRGLLYPVDHYEVAVSADGPINMANWNQNHRRGDGAGGGRGPRLQGRSG